jgi:aldose 1-epimerase
MQDGQQFVMKSPTGEEIFLFTLENSKGCRVLISNYGATITSYAIAGIGGKPNDIVLGFDDMHDYFSPAYLKNYPWFGAAVGRYANRIGNARFSLGGKEYRLTSNNGAHQLHGGPGGFDRRTWELKGYKKTSHSFLELRYFSKDGEEGFPGNLDTVIRFELSENNELCYEYRAETDQATPVNLTHHTYFNLNNGEGTILDHELRIPASRILGQDEWLVADGQINSVEGTAFDLRSYQTIRSGLARIDEYDKSFIVDREGNGLMTVAEARYRDTHLEILSTENILHFYSGKWIPELNGKRQYHYGPFSGFCLETHDFTNAVNIAHFPVNILEPGDTYRHKTVYRPMMG